MRIKILFLVLSIYPALVQAAAIDWSQPPLGCVEEMVPDRPSRPCLDLTEVKNPLGDWPDLSREERDFWVTHRRYATFCRSQEILRREKNRPGSQNSERIELAWMAVEAIYDHDEKVDAIYEAKKLYGMPPLVLTGALYQESLLMPLGIAEDGKNYSCGIGQVNIIEWCHWANNQSEQKQRSLNWPKGLDCDSEDITKPEFIAPFYEIAKTRLNGLPEYRLLKEHFANISFDDVKNGFPSASNDTQRLRYQAARSFIDNCSDVRNGILAKANEVAKLYAAYVPEAVKQKDHYTGGERFHRRCQQDLGDTYPLPKSWLMAVAAYNAGNNMLDAMAYYNHWDKRAWETSSTWDNFSVEKMIESFFWAGKYNPTTDYLDFTDLRGKHDQLAWWTTCVAQRHIAWVVQHVQLDSNFLVDSLEDGFQCRRSEFNERGKLVRSWVPDFRKRSSGRK